MRLIGHAALQRHLRQALPRCQHQLLGSPDAPLHDVGNRRLSKGLAKGSKEMARAKLNEVCKVSGSDTRVQFVLDVRSESLGLPRRESASQTRPLRGPIPCRAQVDSKQYCRTLDAALRRATVGVQCDGCGSQKAGKCV